MAKVNEYAPQCVRDGLADARIFNDFWHWQELDARDRAEGQFDFENWTLKRPGPKRRLMVLFDDEEVVPAEVVDENDQAAQFFSGFFAPAPSILRSAR